MSWTVLASWLPTLLVAIVSVSALAAAGFPPAAAAARRQWIAAVIVAGSLAGAGTVWQARQGDIAARSAAAAMFDLRQQIASLQAKVKKLEEDNQPRTISADTAARLADYLRGFDRHQVVVSCAPNDIEAYNYANQIVNLLKAANWDARGPEATAIFGSVRAIGINVYDNAAHSSDAARILLGGFTKFNIPYQIRVAPSQGPDTAPVELFIGALPAVRAKTGSAASGPRG